MNTFSIDIQGGRHQGDWQENTLDTDFTVYLKFLRHGFCFAEHADCTDFLESSRELFVDRLEGRLRGLRVENKQTCFRLSRLFASPRGTRRDRRNQSEYAPTLRGASNAVARILSDNDSRRISTYPDSHQVEGELRSH